MLSSGQTARVDERARSLVVFGASAGGVDPLKRIIDGLPADLPAAVGVVLHVPKTGSRLPEILNRNGELPAVHAADGELLRWGYVYVAPPDRHLLVQDEHCVLADGPRENGHRPAVDPLFRSAAAEFGERTVGVVLSGTGADGVAGLQEIASAGGCVIVQDPGEAAFPGMPTAAIVRDHPDCVTKVGDIAAAIVEALRGAAGERMASRR
jgi:two-component system, chemotaxis family, protein-glutamate methylesterase/glutaminase